MRPLGIPSLPFTPMCRDARAPISNPDPSTAQEQPQQQ
jgi:hypothetical protein